jgi:hypothetical protein
MFSMGALNTFLYIRMYMALTFFVVCALYYTIKYFIEQKNKYLIGLYVSFIFGGLTEYTFWIVGFLITGLFFVLTIKNRRKWLTFGGVALASVVTASIVFSPTLLQFIDKSTENPVIAGSFQTVSMLFNPQEVFKRFMLECKERFFPFILSNKVIFFILLVSLLILIYNVYKVLRNLFTEWWNNERTKNKTKFSGFIKERFVLWVKDIGNDPHKSAFIMLFLVYGIAVYFIEAVHLWPLDWRSTRFVFMLYPMQSILIALIIMGVYKQIKKLSRILQCIVISLIALNFVMFNNGKKPLAPAYNWFVYETALKNEQFKRIVSDAYVFYVRKNWYDNNYVFDSMGWYYDKMKEVYPMQREENPPGYDYQRVIAGEIEQIQNGEKIVIMNTADDGALLNKDAAFVSLLNRRGFDIVTVETGIDIGYYPFNVYGIVPYPNTPELKQKRIQQETDITRYLSWIHDERYSVLIAVSDECSVSMNEEIMAQLRELGLTENLIGKVQLPYIAVIDRGEVVYEALGGDPRESLTWTGELRDGSGYEILSAGYHAGNTCAITIEDADYAVKWRGLNIVVYDNERGAVLDSVAFDTWANELTAYRKRNGEWTELLIAPSSSL